MTIIRGGTRPDITVEVAVAAYREHGSLRRAAAALQCDREMLARRLRQNTDTGVQPPPDGHYVKGVSTLHDRAGRVVQQWVKTSVDEDKRRAAIEAAIAEACREVPPLPPREYTGPVNEDLCTVVTMTDCHVGMLAWGRETGADWDLRIAEDTLTRVFLEMVEAAPDGALGILNQLGDFLHQDGLLPQTPTSGHVLDSDSRFQKIVEATVRILRRIVDALLAKYPRVLVYMHEGNHDMASSVWLRVLFAQLYADEPRVRVEQSPLPYVVHEHGSTLLCFHHGHLVKNDNLPLLFAARFPEAWGRTTKRYIHVGHRHHVSEKEHPGIKVVQHPTLAAPDAYAARGGWLSERQATAMTYHRRYGEVGRQTFTPEMLEACL